MEKKYGEKLISIIVPCYNVEKWLDRCVYSLVKQSIGIDHLEVIFIDDASTDGTLERLKKWEARYPNSLIIITCEKNGRQGTARNIGLEYASAPYVGFVDSDDWVEKEMFEILYNQAVENDVEMTACMQGRDKGDGVLCDVKSYEGIVNRKIEIRSNKERHELLKYGMPGGVVTKLYRNDFLKRKKIFFPEKLTYEDLFFSRLVIFEVSSIYITDKVLYHYFYNTESTVTVRNSSHQLDRIAVGEFLIMELTKRNFFNEFYQEICEYYIDIFYLNTLHMIFTRFDELLLWDLERTKKLILDNFPDWDRFFIRRRLSVVEKGFLETLKEEMTKEKWENLKKNYIFLIENKAIFS